jgi:ATP-binding cassette subfamily B (MDR/TAP) protein 1
MVGEGGIKLSGGQRQRLAIARSIVKRPTILILDEATSSIDVRGEKIVQEALDRVAATRTTIMIAHRLSTIRKADRIIVLQSGSKKEEGNHEELMAIEDGLYFNLVNAQKINSESSDTESEGVDEVFEAEDPMDKNRAFESDDEETQKPKKGKTDYLVLAKIVGEQSSLWFLWIPLLIAAMGAGGM